MRLTYPGRSSTTDDPDDPVRRRVLPDGRLDPISINSYNDAREERVASSPLWWNCSFSRTSTNLRSLVSRTIYDTRGSSRSFAKRFFFSPLSFFSSPLPFLRGAHTAEKNFYFFLAPSHPRSSLVARAYANLSFLFSVPCFSLGPSLCLSLSLSLSLRARIRVRAIFFLFIPFLSPLSPSKITATPHRTEVNYSCAAGSRYLKYLGSRAAATAAATAAARHRHHRCASCGPLPQTRPTPRAPIGEGEEPMCARRLHRTILSSSLCVPCFPVSLSFFSPPPSTRGYVSLSLSRVVVVVVLLLSSPLPARPSAFVSLISFVFFFRHSPLSLYSLLSLSLSLSRFFPSNWLAMVNHRAAAAAAAVARSFLRSFVRSRLLAFFAISFSVFPFYPIPSNRLLGGSIRFV